MSTLNKIEMPSKSYDNIRLKSDSTLQRLEQEVLSSEDQVKNPDITMTQEQYKQAEFDILTARKAVS